MHNRIEVKEGRGRREPEGRPADDDTPDVPLAARHQGGHPSSVVLKTGNLQKVPRPKGRLHCLATSTLPRHLALGVKFFLSVERPRS